MAVLGSNFLNHSDNLVIQRAGSNRIIVTDGRVTTQAQGYIINPRVASNLDWNFRTLVLEENTAQPGIAFHSQSAATAGIFKWEGPNQRFECRNSIDTTFVPLLASEFVGQAHFCYNLTQGFNSNWNTDFQQAPAGSTILRGDTSTGSNTGGPGGSWWFQQNMRHNNGSNFWGTQVAWGWEDNSNRLRTRNVSGGSFGSWIEYINSSNVNSFAVGLSGNQTINGTKTFTGDIIASTGTTGSLKLGNPATDFPANDTSGQGVVYDAAIKRLSMMAASEIVLNVGRRGTDGPCTRFFKAGNVVGNINLTSSSTSYATSSDYRIKENVIPLTSAIDRLNQMKVYRFNFISDPNTVVDGFIAHEAQEVVPECVTGVKDEVDENGDPVYQGIDQSKIVPLLTAALQEALVEIKNLKDRVIDLENI